MAALVTWRFSLFALWLVACAHQSKSEIRTTSDSTASLASQGSTVVETHRIEGPETVTTTIEEFAPAAEQPKSAPQARNDTSGHYFSPAPGPPPILVKRTVITDVRGPSSSESHSEANTATQTHAASETHSDTKQASATKLGPSAFAWFGIACGLGLAIALVLRFKLWRIVL